MLNKPASVQRRSIRLKGYDYTQPGAYFVTMLASGHKCIFGEILDHEIVLSILGKLVEKYWLEIPNHFYNAEVKPFSVMPNHIHGINTLQEDDRRGTIYRAPTEEEFGKPVTGSIPTIIRTYKAAISRQARRELDMVNIWQRNYYEHTIRNDKEYNDIWKYIAANPLKWIDDQLNPKTTQQLHIKDWSSP